MFMALRPSSFETVRQSTLQDNTPQRKGCEVRSGQTLGRPAAIPPWRVAPTRQQYSQGMQLM